MGARGETVVVLMRASCRRRRARVATAAATQPPAPRRGWPTFPSAGLGHHAGPEGGALRTAGRGRTRPVACTPPLSASSLSPATPVSMTARLHGPGTTAAACPTTWFPEARGNSRKTERTGGEPGRSAAITNHIVLPLVRPAARSSSGSSGAAHHLDRHPLSPYPRGHIGGHRVSCDSRFVGPHDHTQASHGRLRGCPGTAAAPRPRQESPLRQ